MVGGAGFEGQHGVELVVPGGDHDDRHRGHGGDAAEDRRGPASRPVACPAGSATGEAEATRATPSSPLVAVTTSNPSTDRVAASESRDWASSSMIRMVGCPSGGSTRSSTSRNAKVIVDRRRSGTGRRPASGARVGGPGEARTAAGVPHRRCGGAAIAVRGRGGQAPGRSEPDGVPPGSPAGAGVNAEHRMSWFAAIAPTLRRPGERDAISMSLKDEWWVIFCCRPDHPGTADRCEAPGRHQSGPTSRPS